MPGPVGHRLDEGFSTLISVAANTTLALWEKRVKPPGLDGGGPVDTETMRNVRWRTKNPKVLITMTPMSATCAYDEAILPALVAILNYATTITLTWPTGRPWTFFGYLDKWEPGEVSEGAQPESTVTFQPTNQSLAGVESGPTIGTTTSSTTTATTTT